MREFFEQNETLILFAQGLVFFSLAFALWLQRRRATRLNLTASLIWLSSFAFVQALAVWGFVFVPIQATYLDAGLIDWLVVLRGLVQVTALLFLVQFGLRLLELGPTVRTLWTAVSVAVAAFVIGGATAMAGAYGWTALEWEAATNALAAYTLLVPGAAVSAVGLWRQRRELSDAGMTAIRPWVAAAAAVLAVYALFPGLLVGRAPWGPPGAANSEGWLVATGVPDAAISAIAGLALCVIAVKLVEIFDVEAKQREEELELARAVAEERTRFSRDLHDGTIQSIYAAGLQLESIALATTDDDSRDGVRHVVRQLNSTNDGIRRYIRDLSAPSSGASDLVTSLEALTKEYATEAGLAVEFRASGVSTAGPLPVEAGAHFSQILREALSNAVRHADACAVAVDLSLAPDEMELLISDDGCGFDQNGSPSEDGGYGLRNMSERARRLGGRLTVDRGAEGGTQVAVSVPLDSDKPAIDDSNAPRLGAKEVSL